VTKKFFILLIATALLLHPRAASAGSVGDFFKAVGNSLAHPGGGKKKQPPPPKRSKSKGTTTQPADFPPSATATPSALPSPTPTVAQVPVRVGSIPPTKNTRVDLPYAIPVPNKAGFVTSPYSPKAGYVDVRGFPSGTEVKDPYSGKVFLTP
jgi:hypothetical protein